MSEDGPHLLHLTIVLASQRIGVFVIVHSVTNPIGQSMYRSVNCHSFPANIIGQSKECTGVFFIIYVITKILASQCIRVFISTHSLVILLASQCNHFGHFHFFSDNLIGFDYYHAFPL